MKDVLLDKNIDIKDLVHEADKPPVDWLDDPSVLLTSKRVEDMLGYAVDMTDMRTQEGFAVAMQLYSMKPDIITRLGIVSPDRQLPIPSKYASKAYDDALPILNFYEEWLSSKTTTYRTNTDAYQEAKGAIAVRTLYSDYFWLIPAPKDGRKIIPYPTRKAKESIQKNLTAELFKSAFWQYAYAKVFYPDTAKDLDSLFDQNVRECLRNLIERRSALDHVDSYLEYLSILKVLYPDQAEYCHRSLGNHREVVEELLLLDLGVNSGNVITDVLFGIHLVLADKVIIDERGLRLMMIAKPDLTKDSKQLPSIRSYR